MCKIDDSLFVCIDIQEKLLPLISNKDEVVKNSNILLGGAEILGAKILISEQYTRGLGVTHSEIKAPTNAKVLEKTSFGVFGNSEMKKFIKKTSCKHLVLFGIETHVCVLQTVLQAVKLGYKCIVAGDAVGSRNEKNYLLALDFFRSLKVAVLPTESVLFNLLQDKQHEKFKEISSLVK